MIFVQQIVQDSTGVEEVVKSASSSHKHFVILILRHIPTLFQSLIILYPCYKMLFYFICCFVSMILHIFHSPLHCICFCLFFGCVLYVLSHFYLTMFPYYIAYIAIVYLYFIHFHFNRFYFFASNVFLLGLICCF